MKTLHRPMLLISLFSFIAAHSMEQRDPRKLYVDYNQVDTMCQKIHHAIAQTDFKPEVIIELPRGGSFPAALLAGERMFNVRKMTSISVTSYGDDMQQGKLELAFPFHPEDLKQYHNFLIVDDLVDSGKTITFVKELLQSTLKNRTFITAALFYKPKNARVKPDYYVEETDKWVVFPWEKQV